MDNMELLMKVYKLIEDQDKEIAKVKIEQSKRGIYEVELEERCFKNMMDYIEIASTSRIKKLRERTRTLEKRVDELEDLVKRQQVALELYSEKLTKVEVELNLRKENELC